MGLSGRSKRPGSRLIVWTGSAQIRNYYSLFALHSGPVQERLSGLEVLRIPNKEYKLLNFPKIRDGRNFMHELTSGSLLNKADDEPFSLAQITVSLGLEPKGMLYMLLACAFTSSIISSN